MSLPCLWLDLACRLNEWSPLKYAMSWLINVIQHQRYSGLVMPLFTLRCDVHKKMPFISPDSSEGCRIDLEKQAMGWLEKAELGEEAA